MFQQIPKKEIQYIFLTTNEHEKSFKNINRKQIWKLQTILNTLYTLMEPSLLLLAFFSFVTEVPQKKLFKSLFLISCADFFL